MAAGKSETRPMKSQYHFFYGSTTDASGVDDASTNTGGRHEQDSLLGESLVPTDNEEDPPSATAYDHQHVLISNQNGTMRHVVGNGSNGSGHANGQSKDGTKSIHSSLIQLRENHPVFHVVGLVGCMSVCMSIFAATLFPSSSPVTAKDGLRVPLAQSPRQFFMEFPEIDRSQSNDPVEAFLNKDLFHPSLLYNGKDPFRVFAFPFPTGAFWTNLVLPPTAEAGFSYPIAVYPYAYKWSETSLSVSYPALHRREEVKAIHDYFFPDLTLGSQEEVKQRFITGFDPLSVSLQFTADENPNFKKRQGSYWQTYLVQGSPYVTIEYDSLTPKFRALSTFKNVICPGEAGEDVDDNYYSFDDEDDEENGGNTARRRQRQRRLLGVCGSSVDSADNSLEILRGVQFVLQSQEGVNWIVFSSEPISLVFDTSKRTEVISTQPLKGTIRLAIIPPRNTNHGDEDNNGMVQISSSTGLRRLVYHASVYPIGAKVTYEFGEPPSSATAAGNAGKVLHSDTIKKTLGSSVKTATVTSNRIAIVRFQFQIKTANNNANGASAATRKSTGLLMLSLPHHVVALTQTHTLDTKHFDLQYHCIKGPMTPVVGSIWSYQENLLELGFDSTFHQKSSSSSAAVEEILANQRVRSILADNLKDDLTYAMPTRTENIYGFGKQVARLAQLAHIADKMARPSSNGNDNPNVTDSSFSYGSSLDETLFKLKENAMEKLHYNLELLLTNQISDSLLFDASLGGLVSTDGVADWNADFGNGRYNDHHFHYGYLLYAAAVMGRLNTTFIKVYGQKVDAIMHDVAHNSNIDDGSFFPLSRHMSWFDGHSFASGLFPFGNGKSQESSSEAVNCYYGAYLWSLVREGSQENPRADISVMTDFSRLLLAMEVRGAKTYWHMIPPSVSGSSNATTASSQFPLIYSPKFAENYMVGNMGMLDVICSTWFGTENLYVHMINFIPVTSITRDLFNPEYVVKEYSNVISNYPNVEMAWRGYVVSDHALVSPMKAWKEALELKSSQLDSGLSKSQVLYFILTSPSGFDLSQIPSGSSGGMSKDSTEIAVDGKSGSRADGDVSNGSGDVSCSSHAACAESGLLGMCCPTPSGTMLYCCNQ